MSAPYLQPMTASEVISNALRVYRDHLRLLVLVALFPHLALLALELLIAPPGAPTPEAFVVLMFVTIAMNGIALAALTLAIGRSTQGAEPGVLEVYGQALRGGLVPVVTAYVISALLVSAGLMALIVPGIVLGALFAPTVPIIVLERRGIVDGLARSVALMRPNLLKGTVVFSYFILVAGFLPLFVLLVQGSVAMGPFTPLLSALIGSITLPLGYTANVLLYFSLCAADGDAAAHLAAALKAPLPDE
jgi:hypothetical protein